MSAKLQVCGIACLAALAVACSGSTTPGHTEPGSTASSMATGGASSGGASTGGASNSTSSSSGSRTVSGSDAGDATDAGPTDAAASGDGCVADLQCMPTAPSTGDFNADCVARINQFRACVCLPPLARWDAGESCATQDSQYDYTQNTAHAGFEAKVCTPQGNAENECPSWGSTTQVVSGCMQQMFDEGPGQPYSAHGHYINMTNTSYKMVACGFYKSPDAGLWSVQNFQ